MWRNTKSDRQIISLWCNHPMLRHHPLQRLNRMRSLKFINSQAHHQRLMRPLKDSLLVLTHIVFVIICKIILIWNVKKLPTVKDEKKKLSKWKRKLKSIHSHIFKYRDKALCKIAVSEENGLTLNTGAIKRIKIRLLWKLRNKKSLTNLFFLKFQSIYDYRKFLTICDMIGKHIGMLFLISKFMF